MTVLKDVLEKRTSMEADRFEVWVLRVMYVAERGQRASRAILNDG
jgi:hypothetical protein